MASHPDRTFARHNTGQVREDLVVPGQMVYQVYANLQRPLYITNFFRGDGRETAEDIQAQWYREDYGSDFPSLLSHEAKRELEEEGYDGIIMTRRDVPDSEPLSERIFEVVAFRPDQIVSATGNVGTFRQQAPEPEQLRTAAQGQPMTESEAAEAAAQADLRFAPRGTYTMPGTEGMRSETDPQGWLERSTERYLDRYTSLRRLVAKHGETGGEVDFDRSLRLLPGRKREVGRELNRKYRKRFEAVMIKHGIEPRDAGNYLKSLHVPERNAQMRKIGAPGRPDMTDAEARAIASEYESSEKGKAYRQLAAIMRRMHKDTLDIMVESGLISKEMRAQIDAVYKNYLPLPVRQGEDDSGVLDEVFVGRGISMRGKEVQRALGNVRPDDPEALIAYAFVQATGARMRAEQNMTARMAYEFLKRHQSTTSEGTKSPWVFIDPGDYPTRPAVSKHGLRIDVPDTAFQNAQNAFAVKLDGEERYVLFDENRPYVARALNESNVLPSHPVISSIGMYTSLWSRLATGWNPEFTLRNFPRDIGTMIFRLTSEFDAAAAAQAVAALPRAGRVIWREMVQGREPDTSDATGRLWLEYRRAGGPIEFKNLANVEEVMQEMQTEFLRGTGDEARGPRALRAGRTAFDKIQAVNTVFENMVRFAAYVALRERGMSADNAALYGKEMTTNFEQRGTHIGIWNSLYAFANAGLVGFARDVQTLKTRTAQRMVLAGVVGGVLAYALNRALAPEDEDEDNYFATLGKHYHKTNFHVQWPGEQAGVSVPLPFTLRVFNYMGNRLGAIAYGDTDASTAAADVLEAAFAETNPWGGESSALNTIMPSLGDPLVDVARNRTFTGGPIRPTQYDTTQPLSQLAWDDTNPYARMMAQSLNSLTGGDRFKPGAIDVSPDDMMHVIRSYSAGVGNLLQRSIELGKRAQDGLPIEPRDVPFYRIFRQGSNPGKTRRAFNQIRQELKRTENRLRAAKREGDTGEQARLEALPIYQARQDIKATQSQVRDLADEAALRSSQGDPQAALELELQALEVYHAALRAANAAGYRIRQP
jgi:hypothetical protein